MCSYFLHTSYFEVTYIVHTSGNTGDMIPDVGSDKSESKSNSFKLSMLIYFQIKIQKIQKPLLLTNYHYRSQNQKRKCQVQKLAEMYQDQR